jgi:hypothetical protein
LTIVFKKVYSKMAAKQQIRNIKLTKIKETIN